MGKTRQLEFTKQKTREKEAAQRANSGDLREVPLEFSADQEEAQEETSFKQKLKELSSKKIKGNRVRYGHRARNNTCSS